MDILFKNISVVTCDDENFLIENAFVGVENDKIVYISKDAPNVESKREIDGTKKVLMPGLINTHTHLPMSLLRSYAEDLVLESWLYDHIFKAEAKLDAKCIEIGSTISVAEMFASGTTSITDMYYHMPTIAKVLKETGLKGNLCNSSMCFDEVYDHEKDNAYTEFMDAYPMYHDINDGQIKIDVGVHAEYTSGPEVWCFWADMSRKYNVNMQLHLSETQAEHDGGKVRRNGKTPTEAFAECGIFDTKATLAHCVALEDSDIEFLSKKDITIAHNPVSNLKLASGIARVSKMRENGINVTLGTDGVASNNTFDLFEEIKLATLLAKSQTGDPLAMTAKDALKMATINGAISQGRDDTGLVKTGYKADLIMIDFDNLHHTPSYDTVASLVYNTSGSDVVMTMIDGKIVYENGEFTTLDIKKAIKELEEYALPIINS